jgi:RNA polymerase subunit RPABC4/transcription elongation factor Spt4
MMPACACPMCDECARDALIDSDTNACPSCGETENSPDELIPWRQIRDKVT